LFTISGEINRYINARRDHPALARAPVNRERWLFETFGGAPLMYVTPKLRSTKLAQKILKENTAEAMNHHGRRAVLEALADLGVVLPSSVKCKLSLSDNWNALTEFSRNTTEMNLWRLRIS
jgi:hypothetical protein